MTQPSPSRVVSLLPLRPDVRDALLQSAFGPFKVDVLASTTELAPLAGQVDVLLLGGDAFDPRLRAAATALDAAVVLVAEQPTPLQIAQWLAAGVREVLTPEELSAAQLPRRIRTVVERHRFDRETRTAYATDLGTGLPHEQQLIEHMSHLLALREREPSPMALLVLRIEGIATTQARLGAEAGHVLRRKLAVRLRAGVRASDVVASLGDDAFSVLLAQMLAPSDAQRVGAKLMASLLAPFKISGDDVAVAASLGIAQYPEDGNQPQVLLQRAVGLAKAGAAQGRVGFANFGEAGGSAPTAANDD